jgi:lipoate-protein ligase A
LDITTYTLDDPLILATSADHLPRARVYIPPYTMVVLGRSSKPEIELNLDNCISDRVPILRRHGGGCSVVQDPGNVIVSVTLPAEGIGDIRKYFNLLSNWIIDALAKTGVHGVSVEGFSDLVISDRKTAGSCMHRKRDLAYFSASILVSPRIDLMDRYLQHPPREPKYRRHRSHADFVGSLCEIADIHDTETFTDAMRRLLTIETLGI